MKSDYKIEFADEFRTLSLIEQVTSISKIPATEQLTVIDLDARLELLEGYWRNFANRDFVLQRALEAYKDNPYFTQSMFSKGLALYLEAKSGFKGRINKLSASQPAIKSQSSPATGQPFASLQASLEKLKLPRFDGKQREWEAFKEKFNSLVRSDPGIPAVIKFQHLLNCLYGEAADKLKGIQFTTDNFETAWDTLCKRYDNAYLRFSVQMQALMRLPTASKENVAHISQLLNTVNESINTFHSLKRPVDK